MRHGLGAIVFASALAGVILTVPTVASSGPADDRLQIYELMDRYGVVHDLGTPEEYAELFTPDAEITTGPGRPVVKGHDALVATATRDHQRFGGTVTPDGKNALIMRHVVSNRLVELVGKNAARGSCYVTTLIKTPDNGLALLSIGRYEDEYVRQGGKWRISKRRILLDMGDQKLGKQLGF
ncbi:MAG: nuclear transport factor 2 family protein [Caulobacteraceae bacterium]